MGHRSGQHTYKLYYLPEALPRHFQSVYFDTGAGDHLVTGLPDGNIARYSRSDRIE